MVRFVIAAAVVVCLAPGMAHGLALPLDAVETVFGGCADSDCCPDVNVQAGPMGNWAVYLLINNFDEVAGVQTAFEIDPSWALLFQLWDCQGNQVVGTQPAPPWGPQSGTIATAFDCVTGGDCIVVGRMQFISGAAGCVGQVQSAFPFGTHIIDCAGRDFQITNEECLGRVCIDPEPGHNACDCKATPVEPATWGGIKTQYR